MKKIIAVFIILGWCLTICFADNTSDAIACFKQGNSKVAQKDYAGAIKDYNKAIKLNSKEFSFYYNRGLAKEYLPDYGGAVKDFDKAVEIYPKNADAYHNRGWAKTNLKNYSGAIKDFDKAIKLDPKAADSYYYRGLAKGLLKDKNGALKDLNTAKSMGYAQANKAIDVFAKQPAIEKGRIAISDAENHAIKSIPTETGKINFLLLLGYPQEQIIDSLKSPLRVLSIYDPKTDRLYPAYSDHFVWHRKIFSAGDIFIGIVSLASGILLFLFIMQAIFRSIRFGK